MEFKNIIIAKKLSKANWRNGAYTLCFVYSNKGNILIKGYLGDVDLEIKKLKAKGYNHYVFKTFHHGPNDEKFEIKFKRLPKRWVKELDNL